MTIPTINIENYDDIINFAKSVSNIHEFSILTPNEKLRIIFTYPFLLTSKTV